MKKVKVVSVVFLMFVIMILTCGCSTQTEVKIDTDGKGALSIKLEIPKDSIENEGYAKVNTPEELVRILEEKSGDELNLEFSVDKNASKDKDYVIASLTFDSIDEFNDQINKLIMQYNMMTAASDVEGMFGYMPEVSNSIEYEVAAIEKYFKENGVKVDKSDRNVRKLANLIKSFLVFSQDTIEGDERLKYAYGIGVSKADTKSNRTVDIVENNGEKELKIQKFAVDCLRMYMQRFLIKYQTEIFNLSNIKSSTDAISGLETKEILCWTFEGISFADKVKAELDKKGVKEYNLADLTPFMAVSMFDDEYEEEFKMAWNREYKNYQEEKSYEILENEDFENIETAIFKERNTSVTFSFGENKVVLTDDEYLDAYADNLYMTISSKADGSYEATGALDCDNSSQEENNENQEDEKTTDNENNQDEKENNAMKVDNAKDEVENDKDELKKDNKFKSELKNENVPKTGDFNFVYEIAIVGMLALAMVIVVLKKRVRN